jgi:hypothetical protein
LSSFIFRAAGFNEIIELLKETNIRLATLERLLEFTLSPPDLVNYKKGMSLDDIPRKKFNDLGD